MEWKTAEAKQKFSELVKAAHQRQERTVREAVEGLRRICEEEDYRPEIPPRQERSNSFPDALED